MNGDPTLRYRTTVGASLLHPAAVAAWNRSEHRTNASSTTEGQALSNEQRVRLKALVVRLKQVLAR